jgi:hypothetical protein
MDMRRRAGNAWGIQTGRGRPNVCKRTRREQAKGETANVFMMKTRFPHKAAFSANDTTHDPDDSFPCCTTSNRCGLNAQMLELNSRMKYCGA